MKIRILFFWILSSLIFLSGYSFAQKGTKYEYVVNGVTNKSYHDYWVFDNESFKSIDHFRLQGFDIEWETVKTIHTNPKYIQWLHILAITNRSFQGDEWNGYNIPFVGQCTDQIKSLIIKGKKHIVQNRDDIFFRQILKLEYGYNRVYIDVELKNGLILKGKYIEINISKINPSYDINIK